HFICAKIRAREHDAAKLLAEAREHRFEMPIVRTVAARAHDHCAFQPKLSLHAQVVFGQRVVGRVGARRLEGEVARRTEKMNVAIPRHVGHGLRGRAWIWVGRLVMQVDHKREWWRISSSLLACRGKEGCLYDQDRLAMGRVSSMRLCQGAGRMRRMSSRVLAFGAVLLLALSFPAGAESAAPA